MIGPVSFFSSHPEGSGVYLLIEPARLPELIVLEKAADEAYWKRYNDEVLRAALTGEPMREIQPVMCPAPDVFFPLYVGESGNFRQRLTSQHHKVRVCVEDIQVEFLKQCHRK